MKKVNCIVFAVSSALFFLFGSANVSAQTMNFNSQTSQTIVNERIVTYKCSLDHVTSLDAANLLATKIKGYNGIMKTEVSNFSGDKADLLITVIKKQNLMTMKNAILGAGVETISIDGKSVKTEELMNAISAFKKK